MSLPPGEETWGAAPFEALELLDALRGVGAPRGGEVAELREGTLRPEAIEDEEGLRPRVCDRIPDSVPFPPVG